MSAAAILGQKTGDAGRGPDWEQIRNLLERIVINGQKFFNVDEAAEFLRLSEKTIHRLKDEGILPYSSVGDRVIFQRGDLIAFMNKAKTSKPVAPKLPPTQGKSKITKHSSIQVHKSSSKAA
jgi:excisionase family DNA binding protein